ncbi:MAG TPA: hypothetical protein VFW47_01280 [Phenylobacterium sp.]|nr:hypothetical protein [Phenylobacterium sp.]
MLSSAAMFLAIAVLAQTAPAAPDAKAPGTGGPKAQQIVIRGPKGEALICKKYQPIGSRLPIRACRTAYDWAELNAASLRDLDQMIGKGTYP